MAAQSKSEESVTLFQFQIWTDSLNIWTCHPVQFIILHRYQCFIFIFLDNSLTVQMNWHKQTLTMDKRQQVDCILSMQHYVLFFSKCDLKIQRRPVWPNWTGPHLVHRSAKAWLDLVPELLCWNDRHTVYWSWWVLGDRWWMGEERRFWGYVQVCSCLTISLSSKQSGHSYCVVNSMVRK